MTTQILSIRDTFYAALMGFMNFLPALIGGIFLLVVGWIIAGIIGRVVDRLLNYARLNHAAARSGLDHYLVGPSGRFSASYGIGMLAKWFVFLIFIQAAANVLRMPQITAIINSILLYLPNIAVAIVILLVGAFLARFVSSAVQAAVVRTGVARPAVFGLIAQYAVMGFAIIAALNHLGIATTVVNTLFVGLVASVSLAVGLAFGLGGQSVASELTRNWYERGKSAASKRKAA